jgi:4-hydroxy-3-methylbut-2-enyl diphosphate reductase IspH
MSAPAIWAGAQNHPERVGIQGEFPLNFGENSFRFHFVNFPRSVHSVAGVMQTILNYFSSLNHPAF